MNNLQFAVTSGQLPEDSGQWALDSGQWTVGSGRRQWTVGSVHWAITVGSGQWTVKLGLAILGSFTKYSLHFASKYLFEGKNLCPVQIYFACKIY